MGHDPPVSSMLSLTIEPLTSQVSQRQGQTTGKASTLLLRPSSASSNDKVNTSIEPSSVASVALIPPPTTTANSEASTTAAIQAGNAAANSPSHTSQAGQATITSPAGSNSPSGSTAANSLDSPNTNSNSNPDADSITSGSGNLSTFQTIITGSNLASSPSSTSSSPSSNITTFIDSGSPSSSPLSSGAKIGLGVGIGLLALLLLTLLGYIFFLRHARRKLQRLSSSSSFSSSPLELPGGTKAKGHELDTKRKTAEKEGDFQALETSGDNEKTLQGSVYEVDGGWKWVRELP